MVAASVKFKLLHAEINANVKIKGNLHLLTVLFVSIESKTVERFSKSFFSIEIRSDLEQSAQWFYAKNGCPYKAGQTYAKLRNKT